MDVCNSSKHHTSSNFSMYLPFLFLILLADDYVGILEADSGVDPLDAKLWIVYSCSLPRLQRTAVASEESHELICPHFQSTE